jgi:hypothetical protein
MTRAILYFAPAISLSSFVVSVVLLCVSISVCSAAVKFFSIWFFIFGFPVVFCGWWLVISLVSKLVYGFIVLRFYTLLFHFGVFALIDLEY